MSKESEWFEINKVLPPQDVEVETKISDGRGERNQQTLRAHGRLWFLPDMSMYVYYNPTHWRPLK